METIYNKKKKSLYTGNSQGLQQGIDTGVSAISTGVGMFNPLAGAAIQGLYSGGKMLDKGIDNLTTRSDGTQNLFAAGVSNALNPLGNIGSMVEGFKEGDILQGLDIFGIKAQSDLNKKIKKEDSKEESSVIDTSSNTALGGKVRGVGSENVKIVDDVDLEVGKSSDNTNYLNEGLQVANSAMSAKKAGAFDKVEVPIDELEEAIPDVDVDNELGEIFSDVVPKEKTPLDMTNLTGDPYFDILPPKEIEPFKIPKVNEDFTSLGPIGNNNKTFDNSMNVMKDFMSPEGIGKGTNFDDRFNNLFKDVNVSTNTLGNSVSIDNNFNLAPNKGGYDNTIDKKKKKTLNDNLYDFESVNQKGLMYDYLNKY